MFIELDRADCKDETCKEWKFSDWCWKNKNRIIADSTSSATFVFYEETEDGYKPVEAKNLNRLYPYQPQITSAEWMEKLVEVLTPREIGRWLVHIYDTDNNLAAEVGFFRKIQQPRNGEASIFSGWTNLVPLKPGTVVWMGHADHQPRYGRWVENEYETDPDKVLESLPVFDDAYPQERLAEALCVLHSVADYVYYEEKATKGNDRVATRQACQTLGALWSCWACAPAAEQLVQSFIAVTRQIYKRHSGGNEGVQLVRKMEDSFGRALIEAMSPHKEHWIGKRIVRDLQDEFFGPEKKS